MTSSNSIRLSIVDGPVRFLSSCLHILLVLLTNGPQFFPIKVVLKGPLAEVPMHCPSLESKINCWAEFLRQISEGHTQELPVFREEALAIDDPASYDIILLECWTIGLKMDITDFLAAVSRITVRVLSPARQSVWYIVDDIGNSFKTFCRPHDQASSIA